MRITWLKCCIPGGQLREEASQIISILVHMVFFFLFFASVFIHSSSYDNTILFLLFFFIHGPIRNLGCFIKRLDKLLSVRKCCSYPQKLLFHCYFVLLDYQDYPDALHSRWQVFQDRAFPAIEYFVVYLLYPT